MPKRYADPNEDLSGAEGGDWSDVCLDDMVGPDSNQSFRAKRHPTVGSMVEASDDLKDSLKGGSKHATTGGAMNQYSGKGSHADCAAQDNFGVEAAPLQYEDNEPHPVPPPADSPSLNTSTDSRWDDTYDEGYGLEQTSIGASLTKGSID
jgi:hypothetical protein